MRAVTNCTLWQFSGARLATLLKHQPEFLPPLCNSYLQVRASRAGLQGLAFVHVCSRCQSVALGSPAPATCMQAWAWHQLGSCKCAAGTDLKAARLASTLQPLQSVMLPECTCPTPVLPCSTFMSFSGGPRNEAVRLPNAKS